MSEDTLNMAIVGCGYWGKNLVRNFATAKRCKLKYVCDLDERLLAIQKKNFPFITTLTTLEDVLCDSEIGAVVIATEVPSHFHIARKSLEAGKHTYVEKPLTLKASEGNVLVELAQKKGLKLMVGHLLEYHPAVDIVRQNENAWWSLAPHDISVICYLLGSEPISVAANGQCYLQKDIEDVVVATIKFADGKMAHIHCSWLDPHKIRKMTVVGSEKMVTFDDMQATEKIRVYDKSAATKLDVNTYAEMISLRFGDIVIPKINGGEPLAIECSHFIDCILDDKPVRSDGLDGLQVVRILEAGQKSLRNNGEPVNLEDF